jgi:ribonuclease R
LKFVEGVVAHHGRFAFLISSDPAYPDLYLSGPTLRLAMDGDRVSARVAGKERGRTRGEIVRVISRARTTAVGVLRRAGKFWAVVPEGKDADFAVEASAFAKGLVPEEGLMAVLRIERWPTEARGPGGTVTELLGRPEEPRVRVRALLAGKEIPTVFPEEVLAQAEAFPGAVEPESWEGRRELFDLPVFTIDGADAKDFDDAVSLEELGGGHARLGVHIADVSHYVLRETPLDLEAVNRGTSVYLPGRVIPMLPPKLSDDLCSLRPDVPRLTLTCWLDLDAEGRPGKVRLEETVIRSCRRFTYEEVQDVLDGKPVERVTPPVLDAVRRMGVMAKKVGAERMRRGALDLAVPEFQVLVDEQGKPLAVKKRARLDSHRLIEEFMLAANEAVARTLTRERVPFLRRIHENPDPERLNALQEEMGKLGIKASTSIAAHPVKGLQSLLKNAEDHPFRETAHIQVIRSMKLARYSAEPGGHFGLASKDYCHFTSPIRRYPDLLVHRAVRGLLRGKGRAHAEGLDLEALALRCSERERAAADAERKAVDLARGELLGRRVGEVFEAVVVGATAAGVFFALPESGASGLWRGGSAALGQRMKARLIAADPATGRLEFEPIKEGLPGQVRVSRIPPKRRR